MDVEIVCIHCGYYMQIFCLHCILHTISYRISGLSLDCHPQTLYANSLETVLVNLYMTQHLKVQHEFYSFYPELHSIVVYFSQKILQLRYAYLKSNTI